jgi:hypothetical protein
MEGDHLGRISGIAILAVTEASQLFEGKFQEWSFTKLPS